MTEATARTQQREAWNSGHFECIAPTIRDVHELVVARLSPTRGQRWLDIACGTGDLALLAVRAGALATGTDFSRVMVEAACKNARRAGTRVQFDLADAEALPYESGSFDLASSTFGIMFSPDQEGAAAELARVVKTGGRIAIAAWTEEGGDGDLFRLIAHFQPPQSPGAANPFAWGDQLRVQKLLGDSFELKFEGQDSVYRACSGEAYWRLFSENFGPLRMLSDSLDASTRNRLRQAWIEWAEGMREGETIVHHREYLLTLGRRR
jgi:SAM-dependent methyltransferase